MPKYTCRITATKEADLAFAVALVAAPPFPSNKPPAHYVRLPLTCVIAANDNNDTWCYITLSGDERHCIGDALRDAKAEYGVWYYCELFTEPTDEELALSKLLLV